MNTITILALAMCGLGAISDPQPSDDSNRALWPETVFHPPSHHGQWYSDMNNHTEMTVLETDHAKNNPLSLVECWDYFYGLTQNTVNGVAVDFGSNSGSNGFWDFLFLDENKVKLRVFVENFDQFRSLPDTLVIEGSWYVPDQGAIKMKVVDVELSGAYAGTLSEVDFQSSPDMIGIEVEREGWPNLSLRGEMVTLTLEVSQQGLKYLRESEGLVVFGAIFSLYSEDQLLSEGTSVWTGFIL